MFKAFKYKLTLTEVQAAELNRWAGCSRRVFNDALGLQKEHYVETGKHLGYAACCKELTIRKQQPELDWLREPPAMMLQQALKDLETGWSRFFKGFGGHPRFRQRKHWLPSIRIPQDRSTLRVERLSSSVGRAKLPKLGWIRFRWSRAVAGSIRSATISRDSCRDWHISVLCFVETGQPLEPAVIDEDAFRGIDLGVAQSVTTDDGEVYDFPVALSKTRSHEVKLARRISRKKPGSHNRHRAQQSLNKHRRRWCHRREDFQQKLSTTLIHENQGMAVEDLKINNMTRRAKRGHARQKSGLNRSMLAQGWGRFRAMLEQKGQANGVAVERISPSYTSQRCAECGHVAAENRRSQAAFMCVQCGHSANADHNAACNIRAAGLSSLNARGVLVRPLAASVAVGSAR